MKVETKRYLMGEPHAAWECFTKEFQNHDGYKIVLYDKDTGTIIQTEYLTASTINNVEKSLEAIFYHSDKFESLNDVFDELQNGFYGTLFSIEN